MSVYWHDNQRVRRFRNAGLVCASSSVILFFLQGCVCVCINVSFFFSSNTKPSLLSLSHSRSVSVLSLSDLCLLILHRHFFNYSLYACRFDFLLFATTARGGETDSILKSNVIYTTFDIIICIYKTMIFFFLVIRVE